MSGKTNSHICLMLSVYESFRQIWWEKKSYITRFRLAWNLNFYEGQYNQKPVSNRWFQQPKSGLQKKNSIYIPNVNTSI